MALWTCLSPSTTEQRAGELLSLPSLGWGTSKHCSWQGDEAKGGGSGRERLFLREKNSSSGRNQMSQMGACPAPACFRKGFCSPTPTVAYFSLHHQQGSTLCNRDLFWRKGRSWSPCREHQNYFWINCPCDHSLIPHKHGTNSCKGCGICLVFVEP